jgi:hypothetical protein
MIDTAARATNGVKIAGRQQTRQAVIDLFKHNLTKLRKRLLVSVKIKLLLTSLIALE